MERVERWNGGTAVEAAGAAEAADAPTRMPKLPRAQSPGFSVRGERPWEPAWGPGASQASGSYVVSLVYSDEVESEQKAHT